MDPIVELAHQRLAALEARRERLRAELDVIATDMAELDSFLRVSAKLTAGAQGAKADAGGAGPRVVSPKAASKRELITNFAADAIKRDGALVSSEVLKLIDDAGHADWVGGKDRRARVANVSALLSRDPRFISDRNAGGYVLRGHENEKLI